MIPLLEAPDFERIITTNKSDDSPVTQWDIWVNDAVYASLNPAGLPILSEESLVEFEDRKDWDTYWVLDPIDGTRELIAGSGQFCTCLALISNGKPVAGWILDFRTRTLYRGGEGLPFALWNGLNWVNQLQETGQPKFFVSNHYRSKSDLNLYSELKNKVPDIITEPLGSALKFLECAKQENGYYERTGRIMEWDVAAGLAICSSVGKKVVSLTGENLVFNKEIPDVRGFRMVKK